MEAALPPLPKRPHPVHVPFLLRSDSVHWLSITTLLSSYCPFATNHLLSRAQPKWNKLKSLWKWTPSACCPLFCRMKLTKIGPIQKYNIYVLMHEETKEATSPNLLDPALDTASPLVWSVRSADGRATARG